MRLFFLFFSFLVTMHLSAQINDDDIDDKYREDQFYASVTYNILGEMPNGISQTGFSSGFHFGVIRDMPINTNRNVAIGLGLGLSSNSYNQNLLMEKNNTGYTYSTVDETELNLLKNKFTTYLLEVPLEFRWRTSTATQYNFWRIYGGFKFSYLLYNSSKFKSDVNTIRLSNIDDFNALQYGLTLSAGYGTWNFHLYYGLNPIFKNSAQLDNTSINMTSIKAGLIFYIL